MTPFEVITPQNTEKENNPNQATARWEAVITHTPKDFYYLP